jgi:hypothetical protein
MPFEIAMEFTRMFVDVPINVQTPPNWLEKERGMRTLEGLILRDSANVMATGMKIATVAVLTMKAERTAIVMQRTRIKPISVLPAILSKWRASHCTKPVRTKPALRTNMAATVAVAEFENP